MHRINLERRARHLAGLSARATCHIWRLERALREAAGCASLGRVPPAEVVREWREALREQWIAEGGEG